MSADRFADNDKPDILEEEETDASDPDLLVRRSDEDIALFDSQRIVDALIREAEIDCELAQQISSQVRKFIQKIGFKTITSSLIRGLVDTKLLELGLEDAHKSHTRLGVPFYDVDRLMHSAQAHDAIQPCGPDGTSLVLAEAIKREYSILNVFSEQIANAHLVGDIHIHKIEAVDRPFSIASSVDYVKRYGMALPHGFASAKPARRPEVLLAHIVQLSAALQGYLSGPIIWDSINYNIAPFLEDLDSAAVKQLAQTFIFELSAPALARGGQALLTDLHVDLDGPVYWKVRQAIGPGARLCKRTYSEFADEAAAFLKGMLEVYIDGDADERGFISPRLILHLGPDCWASAHYRQVMEMVATLAATRGGITLAFDRDDRSAFSKRYGLLGEGGPSDTESHAWRSSLFQIVSLNLPRVGYLAGGNQVKLFEELTRLMEIAAQAHLEKRVFLEKLLALGEKGPLAALTARVGGAPLLRLNWTTHAIGITGLNELCRCVLQSDIHSSEEAAQFAVKLLSHLKYEVHRLSSKHRVKFLLANHPSGSAAERFARLDLRFFGDTAAAAVSGDPSGDRAYYTEGCRLSAKNTLPLSDRIRAEGAFHAIGFSNAATEAWPGSADLNVQQLNELVRYAYRETSCEGLVFCPDFTACLECGRQERGFRSSCLYCGSDRVDGLAYGGERYSYTSTWDLARLTELLERVRGL